MSPFIVIVHWLTDRFKFDKFLLVIIVLLERMVGTEGVSLVPGTPFHADSNELLFVSIVSTVMEISVDFDLIIPNHRQVV